MPEATLLVEVGCEEIPARVLDDLGAQWLRGLAARLAAAGLIAEGEAGGSGTVHWTPRRLLVRLEGVAGRQPDREEQVLGPPARIGVAADGSFTPQALGFAARAGAAAASLRRVRTEKGEYVAAVQRTPGRPAMEVLAEAIPASLLAVELPRSMRWRTGAGTRFIRPIRWVVALLGEAVVPLEIAGVPAGRSSRGHRTLSAGGFEVAAAAAYPDLWEAHAVIAPPAARRERVQAAIARVLAEEGGQLRVRADAELMALLVNLTEFPDAVLGRFDAALLRTLPEETLTTVMRGHQRYFAVEDGDGGLAARFIAIVDNRAAGARADVIRHGHERVLRARFSDAQFFFDADRRRPLSARLETLAAVTFHVALGSYRQKAERLAALAGWIAEGWREAGRAIDVAQTRAAAELAKCDLTTEMVKEFPELQGVMGGIYARLEGRPETLATAIYDHYRPVAAGGELPRSLEGCAVAVADKLDTIAGLFSLGELPRGSGDPWALRRQANGLLRILLARELRFSLAAGCGQALAGYAENPAAGGARDRTRADLRAFFEERLAWTLRELEGCAYDSVNAVLPAAGDDPLEALRRARDLDRARRQLPDEFAAIAAALKRMRNIIRKEGGQAQWQAQPLRGELLREPAEAALRDAVAAATAHADAPYYDRLLTLERLAAPLDRFFREVRVNADDAGLRANRLALLAWAVAQLDTVAQFAEIVVAG